MSEVTVRIHRTAYEKLFQPKDRRYSPRSVVDAQFSIPYIIATSILYGRPMPQHFTENSIRAPEVLSLASRVKGTPDNEYEKQYPLRYPTLVTFELRNGQKYSEFCDLPSGDPENSSYQEDPARFGHELTNKVDALLKSLSPYKDRRDEIVDQARILDKLPSLAGLTRLLTP